jgi:hypothetical protein
MVIDDLQLTITPSVALYTQNIPDSALTVNESVSEGRHAIILDFNNSDGWYSRDMGTIFQWPTAAGTVLDVWQPSIIPLREDIYYRMSFHFLINSLGLTGWGHVRECNFAFASSTDLALLLTFDNGAVPSQISLTIPNSGGDYTKTKLTMPANKFKMIEGFLSSSQPFLLWGMDCELKLGEWGRSSPYKVLKPFSG